MFASNANDDNTCKDDAHLVHRSSIDLAYAVLVMINFLKGILYTVFIINCIILLVTYGGFDIDAVCGNSTASVHQNYTHRLSD